MLEDLLYCYERVEYKRLKREAEEAALTGSSV
jgi:hypothetical protein